MLVVLRYYTPEGEPQVVWEEWAGKYAFNAWADCERMIGEVPSKWRLVLDNTDAPQLPSPKVRWPGNNTNTAYLMDRSPGRLNLEDMQGCTDRELKLTLNIPNSGYITVMQRC